MNLLLEQQQSNGTTYRQHTRGQQKHTAQYRITVVQSRRPSHNTSHCPFYSKATLLSETGATTQICDDKRTIQRPAEWRQPSLHTPRPQHSEQEATLAAPPPVLLPDVLLHVSTAAMQVMMPANDGCWLHVYNSSQRPWGVEHGGIHTQHGWRGHQATQPTDSTRRPPSSGNLC